MNSQHNYGLTDQYMTKDQKPWFPVMGEFHYSRYPREYWKENIYKMKACGVDVISTYVIWIHHEEIEGEYDFSGNKNLSDFLQIAEECDMPVFLRVGPWIHGEVRNGGFPDWLLHKGFPTRTNNAEYLKEVNKFYRRIYQETEGHFYENGGCILGIQIENEYGHVGGLKGDEGELHMRTLRRMAEAIGFRAPYYTATGWGGAVTGGMIPVMGAYCEAPWDQCLTELAPNANYLFSQERDDKLIGCDHETGEGLTYDTDRFPYLTAELGGGLQVTRHRRPVATADDIGAMTLAKIGSGANLLGYYVFCGGTNPHGRATTLQESKQAGDINDLPEYSYDFNAPIREYGQISDTALQIKIISMFLHDFGSGLCRMNAFFPEDNPCTALDRENIRYAVRREGSSGFLFVNNYQRRYSMTEHKSTVLKVRLPEEVLHFDVQDIKDKDYFFYPFHLKLEEPDGEGTAEIISANVTPLCLLKNNGLSYYCFYGDKNARLHMAGSAEKCRFFVMSKEEALHSWKYEAAGEEWLFGCGYPIIREDDRMLILARPQKEEKVRFRIYPETEKTFKGFTRLMSDKGVQTYEQNKCAMTADCPADAILIKEDQKTAVYEIRLEYPEMMPDDIFLQVEYAAESLEFYVNGVKEDDHFYTGQIWEAGLKRYHFPKKITLILHRLYKETEVFLEKWPEGMGTDGVCGLIGIKTVSEIKIPLRTEKNGSLAEGGTAAE